MGRFAKRIPAGDGIMIESLAGDPDGPINITLDNCFLVIPGAASGTDSNS